jgi:hypothetical protein
MAVVQIAQASEKTTFLAVLTLSENHHPNRRRKGTFEMRCREN